MDDFYDEMKEILESNSKSSDLESSSSYSYFPNMYAEALVPLNPRRWPAFEAGNLKSDILSVYYKALAYSTTVSGRGSNQKFIEASSLNNDDFKVYSVQTTLQLNSKK